MTYKIIPLLVSTFENFEKSAFTFSTDVGTKIKAPCFVWVVQGENKTYIVDSGPPQGNVLQQHPNIKYEKENNLNMQLSNLGILPEEVKYVILTHLHWDHCYNSELFPNAKFIVQRKELQYAIAPLPLHEITYETNVKDLKPNWLNILSRLFVIDGDYQLAQGLNILLIPGHTPGMQGLNVTTNDGKYLICSDAFPMYENFEKMIPSGIHVDLEQWYLSYYKTKKHCDYILPGHDLKVLEKRIYG